MKTYFVRHLARECASEKEFLDAVRNALERKAISIADVPEYYRCEFPEFYR